MFGLPTSVGSAANTCVDPSRWRQFGSIHKMKSNRTRGADGRCRDCTSMSEIGRSRCARHLLRDRIRARAGGSPRRQRIAALISQRKAAPCVDCGITLPWQVMEFDHVRGRKRFDITVTCPYRTDSVLAEIMKCDVRCPNCHKLRHFRENQRLGRRAPGRALEADSDSIPGIHGPLFS